MIIGHQRQWQFLKESIKMNRLPHAYLFFGPSQIGKRTLALEFAKLIFCQETPHHFSNSSSGQTNSTKSGGGCRDCQDIQKGIHPDLFSIGPQKPIDTETSLIKREIQISQIRDLQWTLSLKPLRAPFKIAIIDKAHLMNSEAQSCLLKTLEEPKGKAILILITEYPEVLFSTILSRVQKIRFFPVPKSEIENYLHDQRLSLQKIQKIILFSSGKPGLTIDFLSDPQKLEGYEQRIKEIIQMGKQDLSSRFQYIKNLIFQKEDLKETLDIWLRYFRGILLVKIKKSPQISQYSLAKLKNIIQATERINFLISTTNINQRLALEQIMLELL